MDPRNIMLSCVHSDINVCRCDINKIKSSPVHRNTFVPDLNIYILSLIWTFTFYHCRQTSVQKYIIAVAHKCVSKLTIIGSDNGLSPVQRQASIRTNAVLLSIRPQGTYFDEISTKIQIFSFNKIESVVCEMLAILPRPRYVKQVKVKHLPS